MELEKLISVLETSVKRNGEKPLTNLWLLNILKLAKKEIEIQQIKDTISESDLFECLNPNN